MSSIFNLTLIAGFTLAAFSPSSAQRRHPAPKAKATLTRELRLTSDDEPSMSREDPIGFLQLSADRLLVKVDGLLYLLNGKRDVVWKTPVDFMIGMPVHSRGKLYGIRVDAGLYTVNVSNGKVDYFGIGPPSGRNWYSQIKAYRGDQYLVVISMQGYRDNACPACYQPNDLLWACRGKEALWEAEIAPHASVEVWGDRIFAVTKDKEGAAVTIREVIQPSTVPRKHSRSKAKS